MAADPPGPVYAENTPVELAANPVTITMTRDMTVTATFKQSGYGIYLPLVVRNL